ncbi:VOC family protein [Streptomyces aurantiacus]|uniref:Putative 35.5 kDa protein in transposon n=1 Tax=Streptomyces aurantiacus JA 4570 TaxID=1286094 RepID=S3Z843_9ACTN|nr:VOC family protein [Streptomyces aurantiacus]EPH39328.1 putative 35.5 kDa protein in transposon [Streptomyces aurantiacus JA 4570]
MNSNDTNTTDGTPRVTPRLDLVGIVTSDLTASLAFYRRLGLDFPAGAEDLPHVEATLPGGLRVAFDTEETVRSFAPDWRAVPGAGRIGLAFHCGTPAGVDAVYEELVAAGYRSELKPFDAVWGQRYATVLDPDGNGADLFAPLPS